MHPHKSVRACTRAHACVRMGKEERKRRTTKILKKLTVKVATCSCVKCFRHAPLLPCRMWFFFTRPPAAIFAASTNAAVAFMLEKEAPPQTASMVASVASIPQNDATCLTFTGEAMRGGVQCNATKTTHSARRLQSRQHYLFAGAQRFLFPFFLFCFFFFFFSSFSSLFSPP